MEMRPATQPCFAQLEFQAFANFVLPTAGMYPGSFNPSCAAAAGAMVITRAPEKSRLRF